MCSDHILSVIFAQTPGSHTGTRYQYGGVIANPASLQVVMAIVASPDQSTKTQWGTTPDGRPMGLITAYCKNVEPCPSWVNSF
jgi:hypothetical protein